MDKAIILDRLRQQAICQFGHDSSAKRAKSELFLTLNSMSLAVSLRGEIFVYRFRENADLFGDKCQQGDRRPFTGAQGATGVAQVGPDPTFVSPDAK